MLKESTTLPSVVNGDAEDNGVKVLGCDGVNMAVVLYPVTVGA